MCLLIRRCLFLLLCAAPFCGFGQETLTLEQTVKYALDNNLQIKLAASSIRNAELTLLQNNRSRLPSLNASIGGGLQLGRTVDPRTNTFRSNTITYNNYGLNASAPLFNGGQINRQVQQARVDLEASQLEADVTVNDISLTVANSYLTILLAEEQLANTRQRQDLAQEQLNQTDRLIEAGSLPSNDRLDILSTIALNDRAIIDAENLVLTSYLTLKDLLLMSPQQSIKLSVPNAAVSQEALARDFDFIEVYSAALQTQPSIKAAELRQKSSELGDDIARSALYPSLRAFGSMSTNYTYVSGLPIANDAFIDQVDQNFGQSVGLNLSIPIYNNDLTRINIERAQIVAVNADIQRQQAEQQLRTNVQQAITQFRSARESYVAAQRSVEASQAAFANSQRRFDLGGINTLEFTTSQNNLDQARIELTRAKYQLLFNYKVVQFYLGEPLNLD